MNSPNELPPAVEVVSGITIGAAPAYNVRTVRTTIGKPYGDRQCPVWLPQDPNVRHADRKRCVRWGAHSDHTDTYEIPELELP